MSPFVRFPVGIRLACLAWLVWPFPAAGGLEGGDREALLGVHNQARQAVGVAPLTWSEGVARDAQAWADRLAAGSCRLEHHGGGGVRQGENLFRGTARAFTPRDAAVAWERERELYDGRPLSRQNLEAGHYTQMVWRESRDLGCGSAVCGEWLIVVCRYAPAGNRLGRHPYEPG